MVRREAPRDLDGGAEAPRVPGPAFEAGVAALRLGPRVDADPFTAPPPGVTPARPLRTLPKFRQALSLCPCRRALPRVSVAFCVRDLPPPAVALLLPATLPPPETAPGDRCATPPAAAPETRVPPPPERVRAVVGARRLTDRDAPYA